MAKFWIFPYTQNSEGATALAAELGGKRILREGSTYQYKAGDVIINWGASDCPYEQALNYRNHAVLDKREFFRRLRDTNLVPPSAANQMDAMGLQFPVFCRTKIKSRDGAGIVIAENPDQLVPCELYVEGVNKTQEFRVHVGRNPDGSLSILGVAKKIFDGPAEGQDPRIWTGEGTRFVWTVNGAPIVLPGSARNVVEQAFEKFPELTFGAFDVVYDLGPARSYVLEINSAPYITPETARRYADFFRQFGKVAATVEPVEEVLPEPIPIQPEPETTDQFSLMITALPWIAPDQIKQILAHVPGIISVE